MEGGGVDNMAHCAENFALTMPTSAYCLMVHLSLGSYIYWQPTYTRRNGTPTTHQLIDVRIEYRIDHKRMKVALEVMHL